MIWRWVGFGMMPILCYGAKTNYNTVCNIRFTHGVLPLYHPVHSLGILKSIKTESINFSVGYIVVKDWDQITCWPQWPLEVLILCSCCRCNLSRLILNSVWSSLPGGGQAVSQCLSICLSDWPLLSPQAGPQHLLSIFQTAPMFFWWCGANGRQRVLPVHPRHRGSLIHVCLHGNPKLLHMDLNLMALTSCLNRSIETKRGHPSAKKTKDISQS